MRLRLGPSIVCAAIGIYRAVWLSAQLSGFRFRDLGFLLLADSAVLGSLLLLAWVEAWFAARRQRIAAGAALAVLLLIYVFHLADAGAVLALNARLQLADLRRFAGEWWVAPGFLSASAVAAGLAAAGAALVKIPIPPVAARVLPGTALVLLMLPVAVPAARIPSYLQKYTGSVLLLARELWGSRPQAISRYTPGDFAAYRHEYDRVFDAPFARTGADVILVIVESLSAADSQRTSGLRNLLPDLDGLSRHGMLFRNFFANFEASEGGIVSLLSGTPPLHFPTASTNTFGEYALQRGIVGSYARHGYQTEFLTSVPLQFISMDRYARSPAVGFRFAGGQHEVERFRGAPRYAFQSPGDHLLYEEVLARLDRPAGVGGQRRPRLLSVITASSHPPFVDPEGRLDNEENVWKYVQQELRWLHSELLRRGFFENGVLIITGDHRRMTPISQAERDKYGDSAKARIPLVVIGKGVPRDVVDDRLFQQADLLRMLDRALQPGAALSPFTLWVERYVFVFGVASNASTLQVFHPANGGREAFRLNLRGAEIDWLAAPPRPREVERTIHRQRALQQSTRSAVLSPAPISFGRPLAPSEDRGILAGHSSDANISRDPDDPSHGLERFTATTVDLAALLHRAGVTSGPSTITLRAFLRVPSDGEYWFSSFADDESCLAIDQEAVLGCQAGINEGAVLLEAGMHRLDIRYVNRGSKGELNLKWLPPGEKEFVPFPEHALFRPREPS